MADQLGHYKILDRIGGGDIEVFRARDMRAGRTVAIRVFPADLDPQARERIVRQAERVKAVSHPNIATLYEVGDEDGLFLVSEFVPGQVLSTLIADGPLNARRAIDVGIQVADALAEGHAAGVPHGGLNADRLIVTVRGNTKVLDFGLTDAGKTQAPNQASEREDIAALGVILFHTLTGRAPFSGPSTPSVVNHAVPRELDPIVVKALAKGGDRLYETAAALAADLRSVAAQIDERLMTKPPIVIQPRRSRSTKLWVGVLVAIAALAAAVWLVTKL